MNGTTILNNYVSGFFFGAGVITAAVVIRALFHVGFY